MAGQVSRLSSGSAIAPGGSICRSSSFGASRRHGGRREDAASRFRCRPCTRELPRSGIGGARRAFSSPHVCPGFRLAPHDHLILRVPTVGIAPPKIGGAVQRGGLSASATMASALATLPDGKIPPGGPRLQVRQLLLYPEDPLLDGALPRAEVLPGRASPFGKASMSRSRCRLKSFSRELTWLSRSVPVGVGSRVVQPGPEMLDQGIVVEEKVSDRRPHDLVCPGHEKPWVLASAFSRDG